MSDPEKERLHPVAIATGLAITIGAATLGASEMSPANTIVDALRDNNSEALVMPNTGSERAMLRKRNNPDCSWITDKPSGYYMGMACKNDSIVRLKSSSDDKYDYGAIRRNGRVICGWVDADVLKPKKHRGSNGAGCMTLYGKLHNRNTNGKDFNCPPSKCVSGAETRIEPDCKPKFYRNFVSSKKTSNNMNRKVKSGFTDYIGKNPGVIGYRMTMRHPSKTDGYAVTVVSRRYGWGFMRDECVVPVSGGPKLYSNTVAGPNPNANRKTSSSYPIKPLKKSS